MGFIDKNGIRLCSQQWKATQLVQHHNHSPHSRKRSVTASAQIVETALENSGQALPTLIIPSACSPQYTSILAAVPETRILSALRYFRLADNSSPPVTLGNCLNTSSTDTAWKTYQNTRHSRCTRLCSSILQVIHTRGFKGERQFPRNAEGVARCRPGIVPHLHALEHGLADKPLHNHHHWLRRFCGENDHPAISPAS